MLRPQSIILPAAFIGCLIVAWIGTMAASNKPPSPGTLSSDGTGLTQEKAGAMTGNENAAGAAVQSEVSGGSCTLNPALPEAIMQWCALIEEYSTENALPAGLIAVVMLQESGGNPQAYSASGAVGLMQVMPRDGLAAAFQCPAGPCFANRPGIDQLYDPEFNIAYGVGMLAGLIQKNGTIRDGLLHYGPFGVGYYYADIVLALWDRYP